MFSEEILSKIQEAGFEVAMSKEMHLTKEQAEEFYSEHKDKDFFESLTTHMSRCVCLIQVGTYVRVNDNTHAMGLEYIIVGPVPVQITIPFLLSVYCNSLHSSGCLCSSVRHWPQESFSMVRTYIVGSVIV